MSESFLSNENMKLIWDVLIENEVFQNKSKDFLRNFNYLVNQNIQPFYEAEKNKVSNLMELNKKFISFLLNYNQKIMSKDSYVKSEAKLVTSEEIQTHRMDQFEKDFSLKESEFKKAMSLPVPPTPVFQDKMDEPITELELEIKKTIAQRNYDIEVIQNNIHSVKTDPTWLTSQETSVKKEKFNYGIKENNSVKENNRVKENNSVKAEIPGIKYIKIENKDLESNIVEKEIVDLSVTLKKQISWADESFECDPLDSVPLQSDPLELSVQIPLQSDQRSLQSDQRSLELSDQRSLQSDQRSLKSVPLDLFKKLKIIQPSNEQILTERMENMENKLSKIEQMLELLINK